MAFNDPNDVLGFRLPVPADNPNLSVRNISLNIADGYQINKFYTTKLLKKMDRVFKKMIDKDKLAIQRKHILSEAKKGEEAAFWVDACVSEMDLRRKEYDNFVSDVAFGFLVKNGNNPYQKLVIRVDNAHEAPSIDVRVFDILAHGTMSIKKTSTMELPAPGCK